jgi:hypothetical protein
MGGRMKITIQLALASILIEAFIGCGTSTMTISDRFRMDDDDVITDMITGIEWKVGPDRNLTWEEACEWVDQLAGNWRMPTYSELGELWCAGISITYWGPFRSSATHVWCLDPESEDGYCTFSFLPIDPFAPNRQMRIRVYAARMPAGGWYVALVH